MSPLKALLIVLLIVMLFGAPVWPYSSNWGYGPSGGVGILFLILIFILLVRKK